MKVIKQISIISFLAFALLLGACSSQNTTQEIPEEQLQEEISQNQEENNTQVQDTQIIEDELDSSINEEVELGELI